jgi:hypothetical protein
MKKQLDGQVSLIFSYLRLRKTVGFLGISFPFVMAIGAWMICQTNIQGSLSSYYHTSMKDVFVGTLCVIGFFLFSYKGHKPSHNIAGKLGCIFAVGVAVFRTSPDPTNTDIIGHIHDVFAMLFLLTLMCFPLFIFTKTNPNKALSKRKLLRNKIYKPCGYTMATCIALILIHFFLPKPIKSLLVIYKPAFWFESIAILAFSVSCLTNDEEILKNDFLAPEMALNEI